MSAIASQYPALDKFFLRILGVRKPDISMHINTLKELAKESLQKIELLNRMIWISELTPTTEDVQDLETAKIFPVKLENGEKTVARKQIEFAIIDREEYGDAFAGSIRVLDFTLEEVRQCDAMLRACGLSERYMSHLVDEVITNPTKKKYDLLLSTEFAQKAYAIFRYAEV